MPVDITSSSTRRMSVYRQLQGPEVWRYTKQGIVIFQWLDGDYVECKCSPTFPMVSATMLNECLQHRQTTDDIGVLRFVRRWIREWLQHQG